MLRETMHVCFANLASKNVALMQSNIYQLESCSIFIFGIFLFFKVRGPFVEKFCIEKDSYIDAI